jgi:DNA-binding XRE family transcriptional regulator
MENAYVSLFRTNYLPIINESIVKLEEKLEKSNTLPEGFECLKIAELISKYFQEVISNTPNQSPYIVEYRTDYQSVREAILDFRKQAGLTQDELSRLANVSTRTIWRLERSENLTRRKTLENILNVFEINPAEKRSNLYQLPIILNPTTH